MLVKRSYSSRVRGGLYCRGKTSRKALLAGREVRKEEARNRVEEGVAHRGEKIKERS